MSPKKKGKGHGGGPQYDSAAARLRAARQARPAPRPAPEPAPDSARPRAAAAGGAIPAQREPAPAGRCYLDVAAVRIQQWLARTPNLKGWRGASAALSEATGRVAWQGRLPEGLEWNDEAGDIDGVVSLRTVDGMGHEQADACVRAGQARVVAWLRRELPALSVEAVSGWAGSYAEAYEQFGRQRLAGAPAAGYPPAPAQLVLAKPCDECRTDPAVAAGAGPEGRDLCADCLVRYRAAGATADRREAKAPRAERRLRQTLIASRVPVTGFPDDFAGLAERGRRAADDTPTQLALIYADGNRVGQFLRAAAEHSGQPGSPDKSQIAAAIDRACLGALAQATMAVFADDDRPPVLAHVAGGDDVLVSVPARYAWPFVRHLATGFTSLLTKATTQWPKPVRDLLPSMSAGLVFHHRSAPFPDLVRMAKAALGTAKRQERGRRPAVAFLDVTADGGSAPGSRRALPIAELDRRSERLGAVAALPAAQRATLLSLLRRAELDGRTDAGAAVSVMDGSGETAAEALARRVIDLGSRVLWRIAVGAGDGVEVDGRRVKQELRTDAAARARLRTALELARWWPPTTAAEEPAPAAELGLVDA